MTAVYRKDSRNSYDNVCTVCRDDFKPGDDVISHTGDGDLHPIHRSCAKAWAEEQPTCPTCREPIDINSLFSLQEKVKLVGKEVLTGIAWGAVFAGFLAGTLRSATVLEGLALGGALGWSLTSATDQMAEVVRKVAFFSQANTFYKKFTEGYLKWIMRGALIWNSGCAGVMASVDRKAGEAVAQGLLSGMQASAVNIPQTLFTSMAIVVLGETVLDIGSKLKHLFLRVVTPNR